MKPLTSSQYVILLSMKAISVPILAYFQSIEEVIIAISAYEKMKPFKVDEKLKAIKEIFLKFKVGCMSSNKNCINLGSFATNNKNILSFICQALSKEEKSFMRTEVSDWFAKILKIIVKILPSKLPDEFKSFFQLYSKKSSNCKKNYLLKISNNFSIKFPI